ncbi:MAG TPA: hypothetical protein VGU63_13160 [Candidatus Acidoferrales bacterium]|nr:hypothetical protein [Candidatus Acidoferrales bacterium]
MLTKKRSSPTSRKRGGAARAQPAEMIIVDANILISAPCWAISHSQKVGDPDDS